MKLFTKDINQKLFAQYRIGSDLNKQKVVAKIFNPYGRGRWYLLNSDPNDPDYLWAIVQMGDEVEIGSVSRNELESIRIKPHGLPLERDMYFSERNAMEVLDGLEKGKTFASGGMVPGRYYKDNEGNELRFIGESDGQLLFKDGDKLVKKSENDFDGGKEEFKLFKWFKDGGEMDEEGVDLFEDYDDIPDNVQKILNKYEDAFEDGNYKDLEKAEKELNKIGYTFEYGLDGVAYDLRKIGQLGKSEQEYSKGGVVEPKLVKFKSMYDGMVDAYESVEQKGTYFYVGGDKGQYVVTVESKGFPATEAFDDWMYDYEDALDIAKKLAMGEDFNEYARGGFVKYNGKKAKVLNKKGDMYFISVENYYPNGDTLHTVVRESEIIKMEDGGFVEKTDEELKGMSDGGKVPKYSVTFQYESKSKRAGWASFDSEDIYVDAKSSKEAKEKAIKIFNDKHPNIVGKITNINDNKSTFLDNANLAKGGMMEHGLRIGDKITTDMFWDNQIVVENQKTHKRAQINLETGQRKDEMADGGKVENKPFFRDRTAKLREPFNKGFEGLANATGHGALTKYGKMAMGGKVTFNDKVKAIQKKLLANKKVPKSVQKDYGKTFTKAEAKESAQRIVGAQANKYKERNKK
jgi:hypothetical protein